MNRYIVIKTQFEALHQWTGCPHEDVAFLRHPHRHIFYVTMKWEVSHDNREIEFIRQKKAVECFIIETYQGQSLGQMSCEMIAEELLKRFDTACFASVFEDNENGAEVIIRGLQ